MCNAKEENTHAIIHFIVSNEKYSLFYEILIEKVFAEPKSAAGENFLKIAYF